MTRILLLVSFTLLTTGCSRHDEVKPEKITPAKVEKLPLETEIGQITLTADAEQRLGIGLAPITLDNVLRRRTFGGDVLIPIGKSVIVSAPFSGTITPPAKANILTPGQRMEIGDEILTLTPLLTPERDVPTPAEQVQMANARATLLAASAVAQGDRDRSQAEVEAARIALDRTEQLFADRAGARRAVDDAQAVLNIAQTSLNAANQRDQQLTKIIGELDKPASERTASPLTLTAPQAGVLRTLAVTPGQAVTAGTILFEVVDTDTMWIRVPVYVEMLDEIAADQNAEVVSLGASTSIGRSPGASYGSIELNGPGNASEQKLSGGDVKTAKDGIIAKPVVAPPSADPLSSSVDLYFECDNKNGLLRPGQRVGVQLTMRGEVTGLTTPKKSIIYDIYGGTWVYTQTADHVFVRQRVSIRYLLGERVVLAEGPSVGTQVVTDGAAELFGTEFGAGK